MQTIENLINQYIRIMCEDDARVELTQWQGGVSIAVFPSGRDFGKLIGRKGRTFKSLRLITHFVESCIGKQVAIGVEMPKEKQPPQERGEISSLWQPEPAIEIAKGICELIFDSVDLKRVDPSGSETIVCFTLTKAKSDYLNRNIVEFVAAMDRLLFALGRAKMRYLKSSFCIDGKVIELGEEFRQSE